MASMKIVFRDDRSPTGGSDDNRGDGTELTAERNNKGVCVRVAFADVAKGNYPSVVKTVSLRDDTCVLYSVIIIIITHKQYRFT